MASSTILVAKKGAKDPVTGLVNITVHVFARIALAGGKTGFKHVGQAQCRSGLAGRQIFRKWPGKPQINEPCPEGHYKLGCHDDKGRWIPAGIDWKGKPNDYTVLHTTILSPVWIATDCKDEKGRYRAIGLHLDHEPGTPGTSGCLGFIMSELKKLMNCFNGYGAPTDLYCDWGYGFAKPPEGLVFPK